MSCEQCFRESRKNPRLTRPPLENPNEYALQIDLVPGLPPSSGFENIDSHGRAFPLSFCIPDI